MTPNKCKTKFCRGSTFKHHHSPFCAKCRSRRFKERHPIKYAFNKLRHRAKERGHEFTLTLQDFTDLWNKGLGENRGKTASSTTINRIRNNEGYHLGNVEVKTLSENSRLQFVKFNRQDIAAAERAVKEAFGS